MITLGRLRQKLREGLLQKLLEEWRFIAGYMKRYTWQIVFYVLLGVASTLLGLAGSLLSKRLIDAVTGFDSGSIGTLAAWYIGFGLFGLLTSALVSRISTRVVTRVHQQIRADVFDRIIMTDWEAMSDFHSGDLLNRANADTGNLSSQVLGFFPKLITAAVQFVGSLAIILYYDPVMALITLSGAPVLALASRFLLRKMRAFQMESRKISSEIMSFNNEAFQNVQFIKAFDLAGRFSQRLLALQAKSYDYILRHNAFSIATSSLLGLLGRIISWAIFGWSVYRLWQGQITFGTMTLFLQLSGGLSGSFNALVGIIPGMVSAGTSARRVMDIVTLQQEDRQQDDAALELARGAAASGIAARLSDISFTYKGGKHVFDGVNLHAAPGEIVALVGPTGGGKTTLLRVLLGLVRVSGGGALVYAGQDPANCLPIGPSTRRLFSYVPQGNMLFSGTIADNLRLVKPDATDAQLWQALEAACIDQEVRALPLGLEAPIGERAHGFSEGQAQRLSIARALLSDAPIFLLDEATSALDIATERRVLRNILRHDSQKTIILTTHRPSVLDLCDRVYQVGQGQVSPMDSLEQERMKASF
ncbi:MAG: ABC transporter ATP-binding protein [Clostridiales bacterium]|nr:ABC transporter ATP-binding protein [Clostridiales bacterium]